MKRVGLIVGALASAAIITLSFKFDASAASNAKDEQALREVENGIIGAD